MQKILFLFVFLFLELSLSAALAKSLIRIKSGPNDGGGGRGVVCRHPDKSIKSVELLDLWEARVLYRRRIPDPLEQTSEHLRAEIETGIFRLRASFVHDQGGLGPDRYDMSELRLVERLNETAQEFLKESPRVWWYRGVSFDDTKDSFEFAKPEKESGCEVEQIVVHMFLQDRFFVNLDLFEKMNTMNQAALILHEAFYSELRHLGEKNSIRVRRAIGYVASGGEFESLKNRITASRISCFGGNNSNGRRNLATAVHYVESGKNQVQPIFERINGTPMVGNGTNSLSLFYDVSIAELWNIFNQIGGSDSELSTTLRASPVDFDLTVSELSKGEGEIEAAIKSSGSGLPEHRGVAKCNLYKGNEIEEPGDPMSLTLSGSLAVEDNDLQISDLEFRATASTNPPQVSISDVSVDGSFSVTLPAGKGAPVTLGFYNKLDRSQVALIIFKDQSERQFDGNHRQLSTIVLSDNLSLGNLSINHEGKVIVNVSAIAGVVGSSPNLLPNTEFNLNGSWKVSPYEGSIPVGYKTPAYDCNDGLCSDSQLTFAKFQGKHFLPKTGFCHPEMSAISCSPNQGTILNSDRHILAVWVGEGSSSIGACGYKTGFSPDFARALAHIHIAELPSLAGTPLTFGSHSFTTPRGFGGDASPYNLPWMKTGATALVDEQNCSNTTKRIRNKDVNISMCRAEKKFGVWPGEGTGIFGWRGTLSVGGCVSSEDGRPVHVQNWAHLGFGTCSATDGAGSYGPGFQVNDCQYANVDHDNDNRTPPITMTCRSVQGVFTDPIAYTPMQLGAGEFLGTPEVLISKGSKCSSDDGGQYETQYAAHRCYALTYSNHHSTNEEGCERKMTFDWSARSSTQFSNPSSLAEPKKMILTSLLDFSWDGQIALAEDREEHTIQLPMLGGSLAYCKISRRKSMVLRKISDHKLLAELSFSGQMMSTEPVCVAAAKAALEKTTQGKADELESLFLPENWIFYLEDT